MPSEGYNFEFFDKKTEKVICQICGKQYQVISPKHLQKHNLKYSEYKLRFPDAPLASSEFGTTSKYGKYKDVFSNDDDEVIIEEIEEIEKEFSGMKDPEINSEDEIDIDKLTKTIREFKDPMQERKMLVLDHLKSFFSNVQQNYVIQLTDGGGKLHHEFITDFADPILKINIEFPDVFWHNSGVIDLNRDNKLKTYGWKIIKIYGNNPTHSTIAKTISEDL